MEIKSLDNTLIADILALNISHRFAYFNRAYFEERSKEPHFNLVAIIDGQVVGYICSKEYSDELYISMLLTHEDFRRRGIGTALLQRLIENAAGKFTSITLDTSTASDNPAFGIYKRFGFEPVEVMKDYYKKGVDGYKMCRFFFAKIEIRQS